MLLRASGEMIGENPELDAINRGADAAAGVPSGGELIAFADAVLLRDAETIAGAREALVEAVGVEGMVDAAAVVGNFERMNRIADAIGIPLDLPAGAASLGIQEELDLRRFGSAAHTPDASALQRVMSVFAKLLIPIVGRLMSGRG